jgi:hypothetical protein
VARIYAGILGPLAFLISLGHGVLHAWPLETILLTAWWNLWGFALIGSVAGWVAGRIVEDSVTALVEAQLAEIEKPAAKADRPGAG